MLHNPSVFHKLMVGQDFLLKTKTPCHVKKIEDPKTAEQSETLQHHHVSIQFNAVYLDSSNSQLMSSQMFFC